VTAALPSSGAFRRRLTQWRLRSRSAKWIRNGRIPGTSGYSAARWGAIERGLSERTDLGYGYHDAGLDERVVEYPWALHRLKERWIPGTPILDAGSALNHPPILAYCRREKLRPISVVTLHYEGDADVSDDVRYEFSDLRQLPYRDEWFSSVVCLSTLEHVGMDNLMYGDTAGASSDPNREVGRALRELRRVTRPGGVLFLSVPFGKRDDRGWFRILDAGDLQLLAQSPDWRVDHSRIVRATESGWQECSAADAASAGYNEPQSEKSAGRRTAPPWVSAAEAIALVELTAV
jgi:SAM-dependent methyltransferase